MQLTVQVKAGDYVAMMHSMVVVSKYGGEMMVSCRYWCCVEGSSNVLVSCTVLVYGVA